MGLVNNRDFLIYGSNQGSKVNRIGVIKVYQSSFIEMPTLYLPPGTKSKQEGFYWQIGLSIKAFPAGGNWFLPALHIETEILHGGDYTYYQITKKGLID